MADDPDIAFQKNAEARRIVKVDPPTDNKMQTIWNSHASEPKEKTEASLFIQFI
jgi:hypothetical protein